MSTRVRTSSRSATLGAKSRDACRARSTNSSTASGAPSGASAKLASPGRPRTSRDVTTNRARGAKSSQAPTVADACFDTCSKLSSTTRHSPRPAIARPTSAIAARRSIQRVRHGRDDAVRVARLGEIAEPDAAGEVAEPHPREPGDQSRLARAAGPEDGDEPSRVVHAFREVAQIRGAPHERVALRGQRVRDRANRAPYIVAPNDAVDLAAVQRRNERRVGPADLEQLERLGDALHAPMAVRFDPQRSRAERGPGGRGEEGLPATSD